MDHIFQYLLLCLNDTICLESDTKCALLSLTRSPDD